MAIVTTSLGAAISTTRQKQVFVASVTAITAGVTILRVDDEAMKVLDIQGLALTVMRGFAGTKAALHASAAVVYVGAPTEFGIPDIQFIGSSLTSTANSTATKGHIAILVNGTLRYIPITDGYA